MFCLCFCKLEVISSFKSLRAGSQVFALLMLFLYVILHTMWLGKSLQLLCIFPFGMLCLPAISMINYVGRVYVDRYGGLLFHHSVNQSSSSLYGCVSPNGLIEYCILVCFIDSYRLGLYCSLHPLGICFRQYLSGIFIQKCSHS